MAPRITTAPRPLRPAGRRLPALLAGLAALGASASAQHGLPAGNPGAGGDFEAPVLDVAHVVDGQVMDLSLDLQGRILYCTSQGNVGRIVPGGAKTVLATAASGPFPNPLRAVAVNLLGDVAVLDSQGHVRVLVGATAPLVYTDQWMIQDATDLIVDARGSYIIASATPSPNVRAMNWVSGNGQRWSYYLVRHSPTQLAHDPWTGGIAMADTAAGGQLLAVAAGDPYRPTYGLDLTTHPGISAAQSDGDLAAEADGDFYWIAGGNVWKHTRTSGTTALVGSGYQQLRGAVIAASTGKLYSPSGWSLYVAEGANPTRIRELTNVGAPGSLIANDQGLVPFTGTQISVAFGFQAYDLAADNDGRLLIGGSLFGTTHYLKRITLSPSTSIATVATSANGLAGIVEGITVSPDDKIHVLTRDGTIQRITEGPLSVTTVFADPTSQITAGKDLALDLDGTWYVAERADWGSGKLLHVTGAGAATLLTPTNESRGLAAAPGGGMYASEWNGQAFLGTVDRYDFDSDSLVVQPGFSGINFSNDAAWGDGDLAVDANGSVFALSEDDWSLIRYDPGQDGFVRVGSGYTHPSGLAIAPSRPGSGSTTGWSLYISELDKLYEKIDMAPPASTRVDSSLGLDAAGTLHPRYGRPRSIAALPRGAGLLISTSKSWVVRFDPASGAFVPLAGPDGGLSGDLVALSIDARGRTVVASSEGTLFALDGSRARTIARAQDELPATLERPASRTAALIRRNGGRSELYVLDGWTVRRSR